MADYFLIVSRRKARLAEFARRISRGLVLFTMLTAIAYGLLVAASEIVPEPLPKQYGTCAGKPVGCWTYTFPVDNDRKAFCAFSVLGDECLVLASR